MWIVLHISYLISSLMILWLSIFTNRQIYMIPSKEKWLFCWQGWNEGFHSNSANKWLLSCSLKMDDVGAKWRCIHASEDATGILWANPRVKCLIMDQKEMAKKPRGIMDYLYDSANKIVVTRWNDNSVVILASNCQAFNLVGKAKWYSRRKGKS